MQIFGDIHGVTVYFDDLVISAVTAVEHDQILEEVVTRARKYNLRFNKNKMQYRVDKVKYIGKIFSKEGIQPDPDQVEAIKKLKEPVDRSQLLTIMGMVNYLGKFVPRLAHVTAPLRNLLKKNVPWLWTEVHTNALEEIKNRLATAPTLKCFKPNTDLVIQTDASKDGLGCCLLMDGHPISFASRSLSDTEQRYAQIEKELLSICFACTKFHTFIYGRKIMVHTDHKPLESVFKKDIGNISARLQRMCLNLLRYDLDVHYLPGRYMFVADLLSRNYTKTHSEQESMFFDKVHAVQRVLPVSQEKLCELQQQTSSDKMLSQIKEMCLTGWPDRLKEVPLESRWAWKVKDMIHLKQDLLMLENKIIIPESLKSSMLSLLHEGHFGVVKTKKRARQLIHWQGISKDIEQMVLSCKICERYLPSKTKDPILQRPVAEFPFEIVATDICTFAGKDYLVVSCSRTKWLDVMELKTKTAYEIIEKLKHVFSNHGIPRILISDNIPFSSLLFKNFAQEWGIDQSLSSPYYPKSNGLAERMVGVAKTILKKIALSGGDLQLALLEYRSCPLDGMTSSPAQMAMSRNLRTKLPIAMELLKPMIALNVDEQMQKLRDKQKHFYNQHAKRSKSPTVGSSVLLKMNKVWEPAVVKEKHLSPRSYVVSDENGRYYRRNKCDLRFSRNPPPEINSLDEMDTKMELDETTHVSLHENGPIDNGSPIKDVPGPVTRDVQGQYGPEGYVTRRGRLVKKPIKYKDFV